MWVRGLKLDLCGYGIANKESHPMWVRGLKQNGANYLQTMQRRTPCGCVD